MVTTFSRRSLRGALALFVLVAGPAGQVCNPAWTPGQFRGAGPDGKVNAALWHDDGSGPALYLGGAFTGAGLAVSPNLVRYRNGAWETVGGGVGGEVWALATHDAGSGPQLWVGGAFASAGGATAGNLAVWNGAAFSQPAGGGLSGPCRALLSADLGAGATLFAAGDFLTAGLVAATRVAAWQGGAWSALGAGVTGGGQTAVNALAAYASPTGAVVVAGGSFAVAGGVAASNVAAWNGAAWSAFGAGCAGGPVNALATYAEPTGVKLFAAGGFSTAGGAPAARIARWNGAAWATLGAGLGGAASALRVFDDGTGPALVVGGAFATAGGAPAERLASWNGGGWTSYAPGPGCAGCATPATVACLAADGVGPAASLCVGGQFATVGALATENVALRSGGAWSALGAGTATQAPIAALATFDDGGGTKLYAGGAFLAAGAVPAARVATWDGAAWSAVGAGTDGPVKALTTHDDGFGAALYAAGAFAAAGGAPALRVARWNGSTWTALGGGLGGGIQGATALLSFDDGSGPALYATGDFATADGAPAVRVAKWSAGAWAPLAPAPGGFGDVGFALAAFDDGTGFGTRVFVGGTFGVRVWTGAAWQDVGGGVGGVCRALCVHDDGAGPKLYAGGAFDVVAGAATASVKKLTLAGWSAVGAALLGGTTPGVYCLASFDDGSGPKLHAGGQFTTAAGVQTGRAARLI
ncbi:MAG TPA: hypothetical protein VEI02_14725, partial [Planctomycetota bacterium]|nr:hypothetical protein [Planctomycetota bacterium]